METPQLFTIHGRWEERSPGSQGGVPPVGAAWGLGVGGRRGPLGSCGGLPSVRAGSWEGVVEAGAPSSGRSGFLLLP